jgi:hypothetical protein
LIPNETSAANLRAPILLLRTEQRVGQLQKYNRENQHILWRAKHKIKSRLIADLDPDEWDFPPKPKWMRWHTYQRYEYRFDRLESKLDEGLCVAVQRLLQSGIVL